MSRFKSRTPKCPWRDFLTAAERNVFDAAAAAKAEHRRLVKERTRIMHEAVARAKTSSGKEEKHG